MATDTARADLRPDELAFLFRSDGGVEAAELGAFLQRSAVIARRQGAELRVVDTRPGSLLVVLRALPRKAGKAIAKEFADTPIKTTAASLAIVAAVAAALVKAMSPTPGNVTPMAKAGADLVEVHQSLKIDLVTREQVIPLMDSQKAARVRELLKTEKKQVLAAPAEVRRMVDFGKSGTLYGTVEVVEGELHFRPDGYRYWVPVDMQLSEVGERLLAGSYYQVSADIKLRHGLPDSVVIHSARPS